MTVFYERVKALCEDNKMTVSDLLTQLGMSASNNTRWSKGTIPDGNTLVKIAMRLNVTTDYLLGLKWVDEQKDKEKADLPQSALDSQIRELVHLFSECDARGQFSIISTAMEEHARSIREKNAHMA